MIINVNLRSLYSEWSGRRAPALTIFVRLLPRLLHPVHAPIQKRKLFARFGGIGEVDRPSIVTQRALPPTTKTVVQHRQCDAARLQE